MTEEEIRAWLTDYAWVGTPEEQAREVDCIMAQKDWQVYDAVADQYASAQNEPGPEATAEGIGYALSALYECHMGPHIKSCPRRGDEIQA
jgi:hypothetical protein